jgi:hypothetical protein
MRIRQCTPVLLAVPLLLACVGHSAGREASVTTHDGSLRPTGHMSVARFDHAAALLANGQVLIVGGLSRNGVAQPTAELFDPASARFVPAGAPQVKRGWAPIAVTLQNGTVLIAGGSDVSCMGCALADAELYDPRTKTFSRTSSMSVKRAGARALPLPNGDVLIAGGAQDANPESAQATSAPPATAELYHPATGNFTSAGTMHLPDPAQLIQLNDGRVLAVGPSGAEFYDPANGQFTPAGKMIRPRTKFGAALLPDGRVLIAGGQTGGPWGQREDTTEIFDPRSGRFSAGPRLNERRFKLAHSVVTLKNGQVLVGGGAEQLEVYDPATRSFSAVSGEKLDGFCFSTATLLNDGRVLLAGGYARPGGAGVNHAWLYTPRSEPQNRARSH